LAGARLKGANFKDGILIFKFVPTLKIKPMAVLDV
jgi:hypothetical protein